MYLQHRIIVRIINNFRQHSSDAPIPSLPGIWFLLIDTCGTARHVTNSKHTRHDKIEHTQTNAHAKFSLRSFCSFLWKFLIIKYFRRDPGFFQRLWQVLKKRSLEVVWTIFFFDIVPTLTTNPIRMLIPLTTMWLHAQTFHTFEQYWFPATHSKQPAWKQ